MPTKYVEVNGMFLPVQYHWVTLPSGEEVLKRETPMPAVQAALDSGEPEHDIEPVVARKPRVMSANENAMAQIRFEAAWKKAASAITPASRTEIQELAEILRRSLIVKRQQEQQSSFSCGNEDAWYGFDP